MKAVDKNMEPKAWSLSTIAKVVSIPMFLLIATSTYMLKAPKTWFDHSTAVSEFVIEDVSTIAKLVDALTQHQVMLIQNVGDNNTTDTSTLRQQRLLESQILEISQSFKTISAIDMNSIELGNINRKLQDYVSNNVESQSAPTSDVNTASVKLASDQYLSLQSELLKILQEPEKYVEMIGASSNNKYKIFLIVSLSLVMLIAVSFILFTALNAVALYKYLGGTPAQLNAVANSLLLDNHSQATQEFGLEFSGVIGTLQKIGLKIEEARAGSILNKQLGSEFGHRTSSENVECSIADEISNKSATTTAAELREENNNSNSDQDMGSVSSDISSLKIVDDEQTQNAVRLELEEMRNLKAIDEARIADILKTAKSLASGDLSKLPDVTGDDDIGLIAHWQKQYINGLQDHLISFSSHSKMIKKSSLLLREVNGQMSHSSDRTAEQAVLVSTSAGEISQNVDSVALAVKEMSASIREISEHTAEAAQVAEHAVVLASDTDATVRKLSDSSTAIGAVIKVINSIAEQTNLLALNATIEAARAGDAGKGFAVVANEVKELAKETARATEEIAQQIATIQADSNGAVSIIGDISKIIDRINEIQSTIAAAVEEQAVTTSDINRSISDVSQGSSVIAKNVSNVADTAKENQASVECAKNTVDEIILASTDLDELVENYKFSKNKTLTKAA